MRVLTSRLDRFADVKGGPQVDKMLTYNAGAWRKLAPDISVLPLYADHSATSRTECPL